MDWSLVISLVLKLLGWFLDWRKADDKKKEAFVKAYEELTAVGLAQAKYINKSYKEQLERLQAKRRLRESYVPTEKK